MRSVEYVPNGDIYFTSTGLSRFQREAVNQVGGDLLPSSHVSFKQRETSSTLNSGLAQGRFCLRSEHDQVQEKTQSLSGEPLLRFQDEREKQKESKIEVRPFGKERKKAII